MYIADNPIKKSKEVIVMKVKTLFIPAGREGHVTWGFQDAGSILFIDLAAGCMDVHFTIIC